MAAPREYLPNRQRQSTLVDAARMLGYLSLHEMRRVHAALRIVLGLERHRDLDPSQPLGRKGTAGLNHLMKRRPCPKTWGKPHPSRRWVRRILDRESRSEPYRGASNPDSERFPVVLPGYQPSGDFFMA